jgi:molybdopterin synthase catalytic subunit
MTDWLAILADPLPTAQALSFVTDPAAGGIAVFAGTTRAETSKDGKTLIALDYEAYEPMAAQQFADLARRARAQWPVLNLVVLHRIGRVPVSEPSVLIAVSTPHRADAFAACRWLIDTLKAEATIWKKELFDDGSGVWVEPSPNE